MTKVYTEETKDRKKEGWWEKKEVKETWIENKGTKNNKKKREQNGEQGKKVRGACRTCGLCGHRVYGTEWGIYAVYLLYGDH